MMAAPLPISVNNIVWIQTAFIGDVILTSAAIRLAFERWPHVRQHMVTTSAGAAALQGTPGLASITVFDKKNGWAGFKAVKNALRERLKGGQAVILQPHPSFR